MTILETIGSSFWFIPVLLSVTALSLGLFMPQIEYRLGRSMADRYGWIFQGGPDGARAVMSASASSMITTAGVVFSITIVALVLAANQFGPRLLRNFMRDKAIQVVLGVFLATFLYCLTVLRAIKGTGNENGGEFVPHLAVTLGLVLTISSVGFLIYFIHHLAEMIQAPNVLADVHEDLHRAIDRLLPGGVGQEPAPRESQDQRERERLEADFARDPFRIGASQAGYIQQIETTRLLRIASRRGLTVKILYHPGQFLDRNDIVMLAVPRQRVDGKAVRQLQAAVQVNRQRTLIQDIGFAVDQLVEVAVRALSPSLNDPFTAMQSLDWLTDALSHLASKEEPDPIHRDENGEVRLIVRPVTFESIVGASFDKIRHYCKGSVAVTLQLLESIERLLGQVGKPQHRTVLYEHAALVYRQALREFREVQAIEDLERHHQAVLRTRSTDTQAP